MLVLDANIWVAALDPSDPFHSESVGFLREAARRRVALAGPSIVIVESVCAIARRTGDAEIAGAVGHKLRQHPALTLESLSEDLLAHAERIGVERRLRAVDAIYAATAEQLGCPLLTWDAELLDRAGAVSPKAWTKSHRTAPE